MAKIYYNLIKSGDRVIGQVPSAWYDGVIALFAADVANKKLTEAKFEQYTGIPYAEYIA